jgi:PilZ domain
MSIEQRRHVRFSLDIPAIRYTKYGERVGTVINQISIGGCLVEAEENIFVGEEFRLEVRLPNKNWLPLYCKVLYKAEDMGIGAKFLNITRFEQELLAKVISRSLEASNLPVQVSPFQNPSKTNPKREPQITDRRAKKEEILEQILSSEN